MNMIFYMIIKRQKESLILKHLIRALAQAAVGLLLCGRTASTTADGTSVKLNYRSGSAWKLTAFSAVGSFTVQPVDPAAYPLFAKVCLYGTDSVTLIDCTDSFSMLSIREILGSKYDCTGFSTAYLASDSPT